MSWSSWSHFENYLSDYSGSEHFLFLRPALKESADSVLQSFFQKARTLGIESPENLNSKAVTEILLDHMIRLDFPVEIKKGIPDVLEGFFGYLQQTGRYPAASAWQMCVEGQKEKYLGSLRGDGTVKGATFKKKYTDIGRNDPCPCGSGKKFKKCCMPLIA